MNRLVFIFLFFLTVVSFGFSVYLFSTKQKIGFVSIGKIYAEFDLKKDLEAKYTKVESARKNILDSLELQIRGISKRMDDIKKPTDEQKHFFEQKVEDFKMKRKHFSEDNQALSNQYSEQIQKQLNQYLKDYGKEFNYDIIFGANNQGNVMHAKEKYDISDDVLKFINAQYKGTVKN